MHNNNDLHGSYLRKNSIHTTYNRAVGLKLANFLTVEDNLMYNIRGHAVYFESGTEVKNLIKNNCIINIRSCNIASTDYFPAGIFIQNPDNEIVGNRVSESDAYGIWYHLPEHPEIRG